MTDWRTYPRTPGETFGQKEELPWIDETIPVNPGSNHVIWDQLYEAVREGTTFPVALDEAVQVVWVVSAAREGTEF